MILAETLDKTQAPIKAVTASRIARYLCSALSVHLSLLCDRNLLLYSLDDIRWNHTNIRNYEEVSLPSRKPVLNRGASQPPPVLVEDASALEFRAVLIF